MADETSASAPNVDLAAINAEIAKLSPVELAEQLTKVRVRQKVQQKKQYGKGAMKAYQLRQREKVKAMKETALHTAATEPGFANLWEQINASAEKQADAKLLESTEVEGDDETEATPTA